MHFKFPIEYLKKKYEIPESLKIDLELLETTETCNKSMYEILFNPETEIGKTH